MKERELFLSAVEIEDAAARRAHLHEACGNDADLLARVESLLASHGSQTEFLNTPAVEQMVDDKTGGSDATVLCGNEPTHDAPMNENRDDAGNEIPLGYLQRSSRPDALGRLAHYEILEVLGSGAFGTVLKAFDEKLQRVVAIKVLAPEMAATSPARKRFLREARSSAQVRHENVVSVYAVEDDPIPYLVMEYIPGQTLQERLDEHGPLDLPDVLRLGKQIADGLVSAHAQQLIHRDVKPGNILLDTSVNDHVKITDFGLARTADDASMTQSGMIAGTPLYMAPEQALGHKLDQRADLFSFGSVLYQMISGRPPFRAPSTLAVLKRVAEETPRPIQEIIPEVPDWMCDLIGHLHAKNPDDRYSSAKEVSDLLAKCLDDVQAGRRPWVSPPPSRSDNLVLPAKAVRLVAPRHVSRRPLATAAAILLLLLVGVGITEATGVTKLASTVIRLATGSGTLVIETDDPSVKIAVDGEEITIRGGGVQELTLRPGEYKIAATKDGRRVKQELVTITHNRRVTVRMSLERESEAVASTSEVPFDEQTSGRGFLPGSDAYILTSDEYEWTEPVNLGPKINSPQRDADPWVSHDELTLLFSSTRPGGEGNYDIYQCTRASVQDEWSPAVNLGPPINTEGFDSAPQMSRDGLELYFHARRPGNMGEGGVDLWMATRDTTGSKWNEPVNLGAHINSKSRSTLPTLSGDGLQLIFLSDRGGQWQTWTSSRESVGEEWTVAKPLSEHKTGTTRTQLLDSDTTYLFGGRNIDDPGQPMHVAHKNTGDGLRHPAAVVPWPFRDKEKLAHPHFCRGTRELYFDFHEPSAQGADLWMTRRVRKSAKSQAERATAIQWPADAPPLAAAPFDAAQAKKLQQDWAAYLSVPLAKEIVLGQGKEGEDVTLSMVLVPPGEFLMGSDDAEIAKWKAWAEENGLADFKIKWIEREGPQHTVRITRPFYLSRHECTIGQFRQFVDSTEYQTEPEQTEGGTGLLKGKGVVRDVKFTWKSNGVPQSDTVPVGNVSWNDAIACCEWLSKQHPELTFSLPTEAQWEYACRAGTTTSWFSGNDEEELTAYGWVGSNSKWMHPVGARLPNAFGLCDMHGNVWEWCRDTLVSYPNSRRTDPVSRAKNKPHIIRGGDIFGRLDRDDPTIICHDQCRSAARGAAPAKAAVLDLGFRVAAALPDEVIRAKLPALAIRQFASDEWIDVLPLIDPELDKCKHIYAEKNEWRVEDDELLAGHADMKSHKLFLPLDGAWPAFECELEITRRSGTGGFCFNLPSRNGDVPVAFDWRKGVRIGMGPKVGAFNGHYVVETGKRTSFRIEVRRQDGVDRIFVWQDGTLSATWAGDRTEIATGVNEGYDHQRRPTIFIPGGSRQFVFHRIRIRMLDGGSVETLRPVSN